MRDRWRARPGTALMPGSGPRSRRAQEAAISAWFGETQDRTTLVGLA